MIRRASIISVLGILFVIISISISGCSNDPKHTDDSGDKPKDKPKENPVIQVQFNEDSAYKYVAEQVAFGPRVPGTEAHARTKEYLLRKLTTFCDTAFINSGTILNHLDQNIRVYNVMGSINPEATERIILGAHWDTRPQADEDPYQPLTPADGANDGASGVGVLLEVARQLSLINPTRGYDIILFDYEDAGDRRGSPDSWCLGSQFWGNWAKDNQYIAKWGILVDMVGAKDATFAFEGHSVQYNQGLMLDVWRAGQNLGYGGYFLNINGGLITDDHLYMNTLAGIPTIDIIHHDLNSETGFPEHWHKQTDNMDVIDKSTLKAVGHTVLHVAVNRD